MKKYLVLSIIAACLSLGLSVFLVLRKDGETNEPKTVFMDSFLVFEEFSMKKDYDKKLEMELGLEQASLDSLGSQLNAVSDPMKLAALKKEFTVKKLAFDQKFNALSQQYTNEVYKRLNEYIKAYGKEHHYGMIIGANGEGNVMYVDKGQDITKDLIASINRKYSN